ncbi:hypothetical protein H109_05571 [Trichophyton interdigitale MR816]|uniref:Uncharacterized protein n=1 Tax=Trichophyton interdigitale (strain MR816) TaxID=1215338 RepID=A0A059J3S7_TRIIM|nr:hypothetical protein H109_05571 [Trichophyton interdigitale MR816]
MAGCGDKIESNPHPRLGSSLSLIAQRTDSACPALALPSHVARLTGSGSNGPFILKGEMGGGCGSTDGPEAAYKKRGSLFHAAGFSVVRLVDSGPWFHLDDLFAILLRIDRAGRHERSRFAPVSTE